MKNIFIPPKFDGVPGNCVRLEFFSYHKLFIYSLCNAVDRKDDRYYSWDFKLCHYVF